MSAFHSLLIQILAGLALLTVGFNLRERNVGVVLIWVGLFSIMGVVVVRILMNLSYSV